MGLIWMTHLETGVSWMDGQHKELFKRISALTDAMREGHEKQEVVNMLNFLDNYVVTHFGAEEHAMDEHEYPEREPHAKEHARFKRDIARIRDDVKKGVDVVATIKLQEGAVDWLIGHIGKTDKKLGYFLKARETPPAA